MRIGGAPTKQELFSATEPVILSHPHIPKPLHGVNPRTIKGDTWWNIEREKAYVSTNYHCLACGVLKSEARHRPWLEAHEYFDIDYMKGTVTIKKIVPLCYTCHNFIHSGKLLMDYSKGNVSCSVATDILRHGLKILADNNLKCFPATLEIADHFDIPYKVQPYSTKGASLGWLDWKLVFEGKEYKSPFKNFEEWERYYASIR